VVLVVSYLVAFAGLVAGFVVGQIILAIILRKRSRQELLTNKDLQRRYGLLNWVIAGVGAYIALRLYYLYLQP
jgi:uncharacterized membrane protein AbrB (regulator of aidB expression)